MSTNKPTALIVGAGFGGLGAACLLSKAGYNVTVVEKNEMVGGRASLFHVTKNRYGTWKVTGSKPRKNTPQFRFDMGPSWYLMPDVFEHFFNLLGEDVNELLDLRKLSPSYRIFYKDENKQVDIYSDLQKDLPTVEALEAGAGEALKRYLDQSKYQYEVAKDRFMYKNYDSIKDFFTREMAVEGRKLSVLRTMDKYVSKYFKTDEMRKIMQYPLVFLGSSPYNTPAIYNIMSHIDFNMGVYYPQGGIYTIVEKLRSIAQKNGTKFLLNAPVKKIIVKKGSAKGVRLQDGAVFSADIVISNADTKFTEQKLLEPKYRTKSKKYWQKRTLAPSALIMYLGVKGKLPSLKHHNLLFSQDWKQNFTEIFDKPQWPSDPSLYVCNPSKTDPSVAPKDHENLFVLVPVAPGLSYSQKELEKYADKTLRTMESEMNLPHLRDKIVFQRLFSVKDFTARYNAQEGTALGLAHTLKQTAIFRPNNISKKVKNLYYVGAGTNPGIGMPITLISAELLYKRLVGDSSAGPLTKDQINP
ncbi:MAG: phytoene desaturase family protein [Candidatus Saccharibacteria bacterium]|nr:phytoene desaturase family protein [Candidatus Saccharibacteria bacterium]